MMRPNRDSAMNAYALWMLDTRDTKTDAQLSQWREYAVAQTDQLGTQVLTPRIVMTMPADGIPLLVAAECFVSAATNGHRTSDGKP